MDATTFNNYNFKINTVLSAGYYSHNHSLIAQMIMQIFMLLAIYGANVLCNTFFFTDVQEALKYVCFIQTACENRWWECVWGLC